MDALDTTSSPTVIRTYKKAELEIWKMKSNGEYALLKTYPMCRWSGKAGRKAKATCRCPKASTRSRRGR
jgi:murein L,D-transpeptidase YafK